MIRWWSTTRNTRILMLLAIFGFSFVFRAAIVFHNPYPPSSDIGYHGSIINLLLDKGELPSWNPYHMGGEPLATPPGFHFFVTTLILLTGMPIILAELVTAVFFSSIVIFPAYLFSRKMWRNHSAGLIAAFFAAISALSLEMISWGGYTNIISLFLIILIFYLFLRDYNEPSYSNLFSGALLFGSLIITHTFSLFVFFPILLLYLVLLLIGKRQKLKGIKIINMLRFFIISGAIGIVTVLPWIQRVFSYYMDASSEGTLSGGLEANKNLILANRTVGIIILAILLAIIPTLFMLKASRKRFIDSQSLLLISWFFIPVVLTQAYVFQIFVDYSRFMYFIDFPGIIIISAGLFYLFRYSLAAIKRNITIHTTRIKKAFPTITLATILFVFIIISPWSIFPDEAMKRSNFYTTIHEPEANTLDWIRNKTPQNSVLVADHLYGWWLSGLGERPTLSAAGLEFLIYSHELEVAKAARLLLETNYYIDNGIIQVGEGGPYFSRNNPQFSIKEWSGESYSILSLQNNGIYLFYECINSSGQRLYTNTTLADMRMIESPSLIENENSAKLTVTYQNELSTIKKTVQVYQGARFAEVSYDIEVNRQTNLFDIYIPIHFQECNITICETDMVGFYDPFHRTCGEVIFEGNTPTRIDLKEDPNRVEMLYTQRWKKNITIKFLVGVFDAQDLNYPDEVEEKYYELAETPLEEVTSDQIITWNYTQMIKEYDVSYVLCRDQTVYLKFAEDPQFRLIYNNKNVAVFQIIN